MMAGNAGGKRGDGLSIEAAAMVVHDELQGQKTRQASSSCPCKTPTVNNGPSLGEDCLVTSKAVAAGEERQPRCGASADRVST